jgi:hypothetical protein
MKYLTFFLLTALSIMVAVAGLTYGIDRELARRDYVKAIEMQDFEKPIIGCLYESNCRYYTNRLYDYE